MTLWCLHGNLQLPSAWEPFENKWYVDADNVSETITLRSPSLWESRATNFDAWTQDFIHSTVSTNRGNSHWLMGYSLGGRLALHALLAEPGFWKGGIVIGAHPGYPTAYEKHKQRAWDEEWAARFLDKSNSWSDLLTTWDALPVFNGRPNLIPRPEPAFSRAQIAACFQNFSKGRQEFLVPNLASLNKPPILFLSGEEDEKYTAIGRQLASTCPMLQHIAIPDAGHRVPWENPGTFIREIQVFLHATA